MPHSAPTDYDLDATIDHLDAAPPSYFHPLNSPRSLTAGFPVSLDVLFADPRHTPASADHLIQAVLTYLHNESRADTRRSPAAKQLDHIASAALTARLRPDLPALPAYTLCTQPLTDLVHLLSRTGAGHLLLHLLALPNLYRTLWTREILEAFIAKHVLTRLQLDNDLRPSQPYGPSRLTAPRPDAFVPELVDLLLSSPEPWPCVAAVSDLSDVQFTALLSGLDPSRQADASWLVRHITTKPRLTQVLDRLPIQLPQHARWLARLASSEDLLDLVAPRLSDPSCIQVLVGDTAVHGAKHLERFPSSHLVTRLVFCRPSLSIRLAQDLSLREIGSDIRVAVPRWYVARLLLRVPGLAGLMLELDVHTSEVTALIARLSSDPKATAALLTNSGATLAQALEATSSLVTA